MASISNQTDFASRVARLEAKARAGLHRQAVMAPFVGEEETAPSARRGAAGTGLLGRLLLPVLSAAFFIGLFGSDPQRADLAGATQALSSATIGSAGHEGGDEGDIGAAPGHSAQSEPGRILSN